MSLENSPLRGQALSCMGVEDKKIDRSFDQSTPLFLDQVDQRLVENPTLLVSSDNQIRILCALSQCFPEGLKVIQISDAAHLHRSTVSVNTKELLELRLIEKSTVPGTENHINPTQVFRLSEEFRKEVQAFLSLKLRVQPELWAVYPPASPSVDRLGQTTEDLETSKSDSIASQTLINQNLTGSFNEQVKEGFKRIAYRMLMMQQEIDELKQRLNEKPSVQTDLSEVFDIFDSFGSHTQSETK